MKYKIVVDSCCDLKEEDKKDSHIQIIPLTLQVDDKNIIDDETFNQKDFIRLVAASPNQPKSACPSPESYLNSYKGDEEEVYVVTLSQHLSGSYNSAVLGKNLYEEEFGKNKKIHVFNSESASVGETNLAMMIRKLKEQGKSFDEVVETVQNFLYNDMKTYFVLESLDTLKKNGRLTGIQAFFASALNIKPIMGSTHGVIIKLDQVRGMNKALSKLCEIVVKECSNPEDRVLSIAHCNAGERAETVKNHLMSMANFKDVYLVDTAGVSTMYANDGGIIIAV